MRKGYIEGEKVGKRRVDDLKYLYKTSVFLWRLKKKKKISNTQLQGTRIKYLYALVNNLGIEMQLLNILHQARCSDNISIAARCTS